MPWNIVGSYWSPCSCKVGCPCTLGENEPDRGWCSGVVAMEIRSGRVDGTDVSGTKLAWAVDFPGGFLSGNGTARLWFDPSVTQRQRAGLEAVLRGKKGGVFEPLGSLLPKALPSKEAPITIKKAKDETRITVGSIGTLVVTPLRGPNGKLTKLQNGALAMRENITLGKGTGSRWNDPEMRRWESGGHGELSNFNWKA